MISHDQIKLLQSYRDKSYVTSILCSQTGEFYSFIRSMINIPLILSSSIMMIFNSLNEIDSTSMKYANIALNASTTTILSLIGNFKLAEKVTNFKNIEIKMNKLCHSIEDKLTNDLENTTTENIRQIITEYDTLNEQLDYPFIGFIKNRVKRTYIGKKTLPNILNCQEIFTNVEEITIL
jgi:L-cystine uptake protein TcyP (sodium:dicarboxylate symporter family)